MPLLTALEPEEGPDLDFAYLCAAAGRSGQAKEALARITPARDDALAVARVHAVLGEGEQALRWLSKVERWRPGASPPPDFKALEGDARYRDLVSRARFR